MALFRRAFDSHRLLLPPPVLSEALSDPQLGIEKAALIRRLPLLPLFDGYWQRAGIMRAWLKREGYKGVLADCLIAQACIDTRVPLITYDHDLRHFERAGLDLL
jgi:predicted nucleic acid-binding protein